MATLPLAGRRARRTPDPRILIGIALVAASAVGTTALVAGITRTVTVYRIDRTLIAGDAVDRADMVATSVRLGDAQGLYLTGPLPAAPLVATRTIGAGEVLPRSAVGTAAAARTATVVVDLASPLADGVGTGTVVDLWSAPKADDTSQRYGAPVVLVSDAVVARVVQPTGIAIGGVKDSVELQVPREEVAAVLEAVADADRISAVAVGGAR